MIKYIQETRDENLTLKINYITMAELYTDAAFVVHTDMKSHMGGVLDIGKGETQMIPMNLKINTKSSTEA